MRLIGDNDGTTTRLALVSRACSSGSQNGRTA